MKFSTVLCILLLILGFLYLLLQADEKPPVQTPATPLVQTPATPLVQTPATPPDPSILDDYLDEEKSKQWLQDNGYQLLKDTNGTLVLQKQHQSPGVNFCLLYTSPSPRDS